MKSLLSFLLVECVIAGFFCFIGYQTGLSDAQTEATLKSLNARTEVKEPKFHTGQVVQVVSGFNRGNRAVLFDLFSRDSTDCSGVEYRAYANVEGFIGLQHVFLCEKDLEVLPEVEQ